jgi:hypothetical protein
VDYTFESFASEGSGGIPGLIEYCIYSDTQPDTVVTVAIGDDGGAWVDPPSFDNFSFQRPNGNPSNIPYDGASHAVGTATWNLGIPANYDRIVLHINDAAECDRLYGGDPGTCFVLPGERQGPKADKPTIAKDATGRYDNAFHWNITKDVDKTIVKQIGGSATFNYTVNVSHDDGQVSNVRVTGTITVTNTNSDPVAITGIDDQLSDGTPCTVDGVGSTVASGPTTYGYTCNLAGLPSGGLTNSATVSWSDQDLSNGHLDAGSADFTTDAIAFNATETDECTSVSDSYAGTLGTVCVGGSNPATFSYSRTIAVPAHDCRSYDNTATFTTNDTGATNSASQTVQVCGPAQTGALTIGFWKNTNGQSLIKTYCNNSGNNLGTYLAGLGGGSGPFSNAPTGCSNLATYVSDILNRANATDMNTMLKAQMLASALDVWFSGQGWTSTKVGGVKPPSNFLQHNNLGTFNMDTTAICPMVDALSTGSATCKNGTPSTNAVTAGALPSSPMTMQAILNYAATTPSPFNGSTSSSIWYAGNRTKEEILKNVFDQFNNELAFGSF